MVQIKEIHRFWIVKNANIAIMQNKKRCPRKYCQKNNNNYYNYNMECLQYDYMVSLRG